MNMDPCNMRIFNGRYFNINRKLLICFGLWPYEMKYKIYIIRTVSIGTLTILSVPQRGHINLIDVIVHTENIDRQIMSIISFLTLCIMILKLSGMIVAEKKARTLYRVFIEKSAHAKCANNMIGMHRSIANNWQLIQDEKAREILHNYAEHARTVVIIYITIVIGSAVLACSLPSIPKILDKLMPLETPRSEIYLVEGEYFIDKKAHFMAFFFLNFFGICYVAFVSVTYETMYIASVEHCCALYAIVRSRLLKLKRLLRKSSLETDDGNSYEWLLQTIQLHQHALTFTASLNDSYSLIFMVVLGIALIVIPLSSCAIVSQLHYPLHLIPYVIYSMLAITQGFFFFHPAQRIIDHQLSVYDAAYDNKWYTTSLRTRQLLLIFMVRCTRPAKITAGGLSDMNIQLFFKVLKTIVSYVAVASSLR